MTDDWAGVIKAQGTGLSLVKLWLAGLLGGLGLEQSGEFYDVAEISVELM